MAIDQLRAKSRRGERYLSNLQRRIIKAEPGFHEVVAKKFGVSRAYVCMLKNGSRPIQFTPVEILSATLTSLAFTGEA